MRTLSAIAALAVGLVGCKFAPGGGVFAVPQNWIDVSPDARQEGAGKPTPEPNEVVARDELRVQHSIGNGGDIRFARTAPEGVALLVGRDRLDDCTVLGIVHAGDSGGIGSSSETAADDLRRAAALIGADAIVDVHASSNHSLVGIAVRMRKDQEH